MNDGSPTSAAPPTTTGAAPPETAQGPTRSDRTMLVTVVLGHAIKHIFAAGFFILLPELKRDLALSNATIGAISTSRMVAGGVVNLVAGFAADRLPHRWAAILGVSMAMVGVFYFLLGIAPNLGVIVVAGVLSSIAVTFWHPSAIGALARRFVNRRGLAISLHGAGGSIGEALGPLIAGALLIGLTWRVILQGSVVPAVGAGVVIWLLLRNLAVQRGGGMSVQVYLEALRVFLGNRRLQVLLLLVSAFSVAQGSLMTFIPIYLREDVGYTTFQTGLYTALAQGVGIISQPALGYLSDRYGRRAVLLPSVTVPGPVGAGPLRCAARDAPGADHRRRGGVRLSAAGHLPGGGLGHCRGALAGHHRGPGLCRHDGLLRRLAVRLRASGRHLRGAQRLRVRGVREPGHCGPPGDPGLAGALPSHALSGAAVRPPSPP